MSWSRQKTAMPSTSSAARGAKQLVVAITQRTASAPTRSTARRKPSMSVCSSSPWRQGSTTSGSRPGATGTVQVSAAAAGSRWRGARTSCKYGLEAALLVDSRPHNVARCRALVPGKGREAVIRGVAAPCCCEHT